MAGSYNKAIIVGRLGRDPELRYTQSGTPVMNIPVATDESYTDGQGNRQQRTEWHRVVLWNKNAENAANYLSKGSLVLVEGPIQTRKWQDQQGQDRYTTEIRALNIQFLPSGNRQSGEQSSVDTDGEASGENAPPMTDDAPF